MKVQIGDLETGLSIQSSHVFQNTSEIAVEQFKQTEKQEKRKATDKAKSQCKRSCYNGNDNALNSRRAYSRYITKHAQYNYVDINNFILQIVMVNRVECDNGGDCDG